MLWTEEAIEVLKTLAAQGRSARAIAEVLGAPSRSAVIGKASRVGVQLNGGGMARERAPRAERPMTPRVPRVRAAPGERGPRAISSRHALVPAAPREPRRAQWIFAEAEVGEMLRVGFEEIRETNCRWPLGDPTSEDFAYCGLPPVRGHSYCAGHCRMAYQPPKGTVDSAGRVARFAGGGAVLAFPARTRPERPDTQTAGAPEAADPDVFAFAREAAAAF